MEDPRNTFGQVKKMLQSNVEYFQLQQKVSRKEIRCVRMKEQIAASLNIHINMIDLIS